MSEKQIKLYALSTCIHCRHTKDFFNECGIKYDCIDVDTLQGEERQAMIDEVKRYNANCTFPTIVIGDKVIVGFRKDEIEEALKS